MLFSADGMQDKTAFLGLRSTITQAAKAVAKPNYLR